VPHQKELSSSFRRRTPRSTKSASSLQSFRRSTIESRIDEEGNGYQEPEVLKPKSDSYYLSKIASHTRKVASKLVKPKGATSSTDGSKKSRRSKHRSTNVSSSKPTEDKSSSHSYRMAISYVNPIEFPCSSTVEAFASSRPKKRTHVALAYRDPLFMNYFWLVG
jgi:hypothetical protein